jgi:UbiD family decarboxylase
MAEAWGLRPWLDEMRRRRQLREVRGAHWDLEIGAITDLNAKHGRWALLFEDIPDYPEARLLTGTLLGAARVAYTVGLEGCGDDAALVRAYRRRLAECRGELEALAGSPSGRHFEEVGDAPCFENRLEGDDLDLLRFPACRWHERDGGRYLGTLDAVVTRDGGWINVGAYRMMVHDPRTLCLFVNASHHGSLHLAAAARRGEPLPIAISLGHHPLASALGGLEVPTGVCEYDYAAVLRGRPYPVVRAPLTGLPVPADSEVTLEGFVSQETVPEGPYGEFLGYYAGGTMQTPTVRIRAVYHRNRPILLGTAAGIPPYDYGYYRCPIRAAMLWNALERTGVPGVAGVWCHEAGYSRALIVVAIRQAYQGHAQQVGFLASQLSESAFGGKYVIVVDDDIDPTDTDQVLWALASRTDPATSIEFIRHSWGMALDPMVERGPEQALNELSMSRAVIDACKPIGRLQRGQFPASVAVSDELAERVMARWRELFAPGSAPLLREGR